MLERIGELITDTILMSKKSCRFRPYSPFCRFTLVFRSSFLRLRSFEGESSTSASSCDVLEAIFSTPSGNALILFNIFFRKCARLSLLDFVCPCHLGFVGDILIGIPKNNVKRKIRNISDHHFQYYTIQLCISTTSITVNAIYELFPSQFTRWLIIIYNNMPSFLLFNLNTFLFTIAFVTFRLCRTFPLNTKEKISPLFF